MRRGSFTVMLALVASFLALGLAGGDDSELDTSKLAPEALLCLKIAKKEVIKGSAVDDYIELLSDGDTEGWNKKRKKDGGKVLDLAAKTWDTSALDDLVMKLEGLDLHDADLSNVIFMPGTSFAFSDLTGASFRGSCLEGVKFASIWSFEERTEKQVRSTTLVNADFRDVVWTWCSALDRTVKRCAPEKRRAQSPESKRRKQELEQQRLMEQLRRVQMGGRGSSDAFAFCDLEGIEVDKDAPVNAGDDDEPRAQGPQPGASVLGSRTVERLIRAARAGTIDRAIDKLASRRRSAHTRECANPLKSEPVLAAAIAAASSSLAGIETWKAVLLSEPVVAGEAIIAADDVLLVIDNPRAVASAPVLIARGPIFAWRNAVLPLTFSASAIILKDQASCQGVLHGHPIFALSERLHGEHKQVGEGAGTFHSAVIAEVPGVENLSEAEAERRALQEAKLKDYATTQGDLWEGARILDPTKDAEGTDPQKSLPEDVRTQVLSEVGKDALDEMHCYKLSGQVANDYQAVISNDPKAILVVAGSFQGHGSIYSEGPVVFLEAKQNTWIQRCVTKSWVAVKGEPRVGQFTQLGKRVDVEVKKEKEKDDD